AKFWIDARGNHAGRTDFGTYNQDGGPALKQQTIEGHAVRAALFGEGMIAVGETAKAPEYVDVAQRLWENMVGRRMYVTGGIGSYADDEKFGPDYHLPNDGYLETCAAVESCFFSGSLNLARGDARTVDEFERSLYNNALAGVALSGTGYFYENPLQAGPKRTRWAWHTCPCCPPMFLKLMGAMPAHIYATDANGGLYVNLFVGSTAKLKIGDVPVNVTQTTNYPWEGDAKLTVKTAGPKAFDLYVRVPAWTRGGPSFGGLYQTAAGGADAFVVSVNGQVQASPTIERGYAKLSRTWRSGDVVEVRMPMTPRRVTADERVESARGQVVLQRGPLVYCIESPDQTKPVGELLLPDDAPLKAESRPDLLGGVTAQRG
ncbi:glycoside hydrolase family 127 protein, partial [bacterium]